MICHFQHLKGSVHRTTGNVPLDVRTTPIYTKFGIGLATHLPADPKVQFGNTPVVGVSFLQNSYESSKWTGFMRVCRVSEAVHYAQYAARHGGSPPSCFLRAEIWNFASNHLGGGFKHFLFSSLHWGNDPI